jgi:tetratricopeptide (TPR) repeat protein
MPTNIINSPTNIGVRGGTTVNNVIANNGNANIAGFNRPYAGYHGGWYHGSWGRGWNAWPSFWAGSAIGTYRGLALGSGGWYGSAIPEFAFDNPYYEEPVVLPTVVESPAVTVQAVFNYSQPIEVPARDKDVLDEDVEAQAGKLFGQARDAFRDGRPASALRFVDRALNLVPGDTLMHEFRALVFFAQRNYKDAAAILYAVLAKGPGWDWDTLAGFYPPGDSYTKQFTALEDYCKKHPKASEAYFLLGYHYLVLGEKDAAASAFAVSAKLEPKNKLAASLASSLVAKPPEDADEK